MAEADAKNAVKTADMEKIRETFAKLEPLLKNKNPECDDLLDDIHAIPGSEELVLQMDKFKFKQALEELLRLKKEMGIE